jgi:hypothetical protein
MIKNLTTLNLVALVSLLSAGSLSAQTIFIDDFDDGLAGDRWSDLQAAQEEPNIAVDGTVDYAFDYSTILNPFDGGNPIPSAPNSTGGTTLGVYMTSNNTDQCPTEAGCTDSDEGEGVGIFHETFDLPASGNYIVQADVFLYWNGGGGSTEYTTFGVNHGRSANVPLRFDLNNGDGIAWQADSDGDTATDLIRFEGPGGETALGDWNDFTVPGIDNDGTVPDGIFSQWVTMEIVHSDTFDNITWKINGATIDVFDNSTANFNAGTILLGHSDAFNSVNAAVGGFTNGSIFDNVSVTVVPEPTAIVLAMLAACGLVCRGRRS